jgi:hypothetical protein
VAVGKSGEEVQFVIGFGDEQWCSHDGFPGSL